MHASSRRSRPPIWLVLALVGLAAGCGQTTGAGATLKIGLVPVGTTDPYWQAVHAGATQEAARLGVEVLWPTSFRAGDVSRQIAAIEDMRRRGAAGIAIAPINEDALRRVVDELAQAGVPTVIFDTPLGRDDFPFIGSDNYAAGRLAGQRMAEAVNERGGVIVMHTRPGAASVNERIRGFLDVVADYPAMAIVSEAAVGAGIEEAFVTSHDVLRSSNARETGRVAGVFTPTQATTLGMVRALENLELTRQIVHVGFDTSPLLANLLRRRVVDALVVQDPGAIGGLSVATLKRMIDGERPEPRIATRTVVATPDNADELAISALLKPNLTIIH